MVNSTAVEVALTCSWKSQSHRRSGFVPSWWEAAEEKAWCHVVKDLIEQLRAKRYY